MLFTLLNTFSTKISGFDANQWGIWAVNKAIDSVPYLTQQTINGILITSPFIGYTVYGTLAFTGGLKLAEYGYNYKYFLNKTMEATPVVSHAMWVTQLIKGTVGQKTMEIDYYPLFNKVMTSSIMTSIGVAKFFKEQEEIINKTETEIMKNPTTIMEVPKYIAALPQEKIDAIDVLKQNLQNYTFALNKVTKLVELEISDKNKLVRLDFLAPYMQKEYYGEIVRRSPNSPTPYYLLSELGPQTKVNDFVIEELFVIESSKVESYLGKPDTEFYFKVGGRLKIAIQAEARAKELKIKRMRKTNDEGFCFFNIPITQELKNNPDCAGFMKFLEENPDLPNNKIELHYDAAGNLYTVTMPLYTNEHAIAVINTLEEIQKCAIEMQESSTALTMSYGSVAMAAAAVVLPWQEIYTNLTHMNEIVSAIQNPEAARAIISSLQTVGQIVPDFLQPFATNPVITAAQDVNPSEIASIKQPVPTSILPSTFGFNWTTGLSLVVAGCAIGGTLYCIKNGIPNPFAAKEVVESANGTDLSQYFKVR